MRLISRQRYLVLIRTCLCEWCESVTGRLGTLSADAARQLDVLGHDGDTLGVDGAQVGVLKQADQVSLAGLLQRHDSAALEAQVGLEVLSNLANQTLEGELADQQLSALLVATDLTEGDRSGAVTVGLLDATGGRRALASGLSGQLLTRRLAAGGLASSLLSTGHCRDLTSCKVAPSFTNFYTLSLGNACLLAHAHSSATQRTLKRPRRWLLSPVPSANEIVDTRSLSR